MSTSLHARPNGLAGRISPRPRDLCPEGLEQAGRAEAVRRAQLQILVRGFIVSDGGVTVVGKSQEVTK
jgi:hypothetical protein